MLNRLVGATALIFCALTAYFVVVAVLAGRDALMDEYHWLVVGGWVAAGACAIPAMVLACLWANERDRTIMSEVRAEEAAQAQQS